MKPASVIEAFLETLVEKVADRVVEKLGPRLGATPELEEYSSLTLPPDCQKKARFNTVVANVPGAEKRGRVWFVPKSAWHEYRRRKPKGPPPIYAGYTAEDIALADAAIAASGFRPTRRAS